MKLTQLSQNEMNHLIPGQRTIQDKLLGIEGADETEAVAAAAALSLTTPITLLSVDGTKAYTLADGTYSGQEKVVKCVAATNTPLGTLTIASPETTAGLVVSSTHVFTSVGQELHLIWSGTKWQVKRTVRAGTQVAVIGTTVLTGFTLCKLLDCQVTATVSSTTTKSVPNGQWPGDRLYLGCSVAASTPIGNINFTGSTLAGAAVTDLQAIGATTDTVTLEWTGTKWLVVANSGITVA